MSSRRLRNLIICHNLCVVLFLVRYSIRRFTYPRSSGMVEDKSGESGTFLFIRCVPGFCDGRRSFPTNENSNLYRRVGDLSMMYFTHYQSSKLLGDYSIYWQNLGLSVKAKNRGTQGRFFQNRMKTLFRLSRVLLDL